MANYYPLNYIVIEETFMTVKNPPSTLLNDLPTRLVANFNYIIVTDVATVSFKYLKNRYDGETNVNIPLSELPKHIRRIHVNLGYPITWYDRIHRYVWIQTVDFFNWIKV